MAAHAFLSYSRADGSQPEKLYQFLSDEGFRVWRDINDIPAGEIFRRNIEGAIRLAGCLLVLITPDAEKSAEVRKEVEIALAHRIPLIPLLRDRAPEELDPWWKSRILDRQIVCFSIMDSGTKSRIRSEVERHIARICRTVALFNVKGGVGKTTMCLQLAVRLQERGMSVLLIDVDPQQNLTELCLSPMQWEKAERESLTVVGLFEPSRIGQVTTEENIHEIVQGTAEPGKYRQLCLPLDAYSETKLDIIPGDFRCVKYTGLGRNAGVFAVGQFCNAVASLKSFYDYIIFDCNPSVSFLTMAVLESCDEMLVPVKPDYFARRGVVFIRRTVEDYYRPQQMPRVTGVFNFTRGERASEAERRIIRLLREGDEIAAPGSGWLAGKYLSATIPESGYLRSKHGIIRRARQGNTIVHVLRRLAGTGSADQALDIMVNEYVLRIHSFGEDAGENA